MDAFTLSLYLLKFLVPSFCFTFLFRVFGMGYKSKKRLIIGFSLYLSYMLIVPTVLILTMGYGEFTHISSLVMLVSILPILIFSTDTVGKTIFLALTVNQMNTVVSVILNMVRHVMQFSYLTLVIVLTIVCPIVLYFMIKFIAKPLRFMADHIHSEIYSLLAIPAIVMLVIYLIPIYPQQNFSNHPVFCSFLMLSIELTFFLFIFTLYRNLQN